MTQVFIGMVDKQTDARHVLLVTVSPAVENVADLTTGGKPKTLLDWGVDADANAATNLAALLLSWAFGKIAAGPDHSRVTDKMLDTFTEEVVQHQLHTGKMWFLSAAQIRAFVPQVQ